MFDGQQKRMIHALENEVIQKQSLLNDIPKTSFEIALMKLSEYQKVEIEKLQTRVSELEKQDEDKADVKKLEETELEKLQTRVALLEKQVDDKTEEVKRLKEGTKVMKSKESENLQLLGPRSIIGVKRMGELDSKAFGSALKGICSSSSAELISNQSVLLCNFWEQMLRGQAWHPFKITMVDGKHQELIDEEDKLLKGLKNEWGERAYFAVVNALVEMNKYNPSGRNPVQELWNFKENSRATVMEGVAVLVGRLKKYRTPTPTATMSLVS
ncbi:factor of DNA methylation 2-like [Papaver somniferum]|uniref:factor of DNA methylation 2-like n=1 Tax=Papaver somniferum TaxID=3469 RepID=UPI000E6F97E6|nr:factor of DNA methylation 2-like [Papaver somniferum]